MPTETIVAEIHRRLPKKQRSKITISGFREHAKASEKYVDVQLKYAAGEWEGSVPIHYRRTGLFAESAEEIAAALSIAFESLQPGVRKKWFSRESKHWAKFARKDVTRAFFDKLGDFRWHCVNSSLPQNPNWARRIQDIKEMGYTLATNTGRYCKRCKKNLTHIQLLAIPRGAGGGYEAWGPELRERILDVLGHYDVFEDRAGKNYALLPDHKFPEIRWDNKTRRKSLGHLKDDKIREQFQLLSNQRNQQKREVCRTCFQTGARGTPFGIPFFYRGGQKWPASVPRVGAAAEKGCLGCGWYDMKRWREELRRRIRGL